MNESAMPPTPPVTIVLVEDDPEHTQLIEQALRRLRFTNDLLIFNTGQDALDYLLAEPSSAEASQMTPVLLLLTLSLLGLDGHQVLEGLQAAGRTAAIPVIMLVQAEEPADIERCRALGYPTVVTKPVDDTALVEAIRQAGLFLSVVRAPPEPPD